jgi:hypothetical protein
MGHECAALYETLRLHHQDARDDALGSGDMDQSSDSFCARVLQYKPLAPLRLLRWSPDTPAEQAPLGWLMAEASARCMDGAYLPDAGTVVLLEAIQAEDDDDQKWALIDDDKHHGQTQLLLTDMFTRMSLR